MNIKSVIYKITNIINNKCYIGSAVNCRKRRNEHFSNLKLGKHPNNILQRSFNKYGSNQFTFEVIEYVPDKNSLIEREQHYLDTLKPEYNICKIAGSRLGVKYSEEKLKIITEANRLMAFRYKNSNIPHFNKGRVMSDESKLLISSAKKDYYKYNTHYRCGKKITDDLRIKLGREIFQINKDTDEIIKIWSVIKDAAIFYNTTDKNIISVCKNKSNTAVGFKWKYV